MPAPGLYWEGRLVHDDLLYNSIHSLMIMFWKAFRASWPLR